jgi:flagellar hook-length control protein FliK
MSNFIPGSNSPSASIFANASPAQSQSFHEILAAQRQLLLAEAEQNPAQETDAASPLSLNSRLRPPNAEINPLLAFFQELQALNLPAGALVMDPEHMAKLRETLLNSGYTSQEIDDLLKISSLPDGAVNLQALGQAVLQNPPAGGQALILKTEDKPLFAQAMLDLGVSAAEVESFCNSAVQVEDGLLLRNIAGLLSKAAINPEIGAEGTVSGQRLQALLQKLGLQPNEISAVMNRAAGQESQANAAAMMALLEAAARKQNLQIGQSMRDILQRSQTQAQDPLNAGDGERLRAQMIQFQQAAEARSALSAQTALAGKAPEQQPQEINGLNPKDASARGEIFAKSEQVIEAQGDAAKYSGQQGQTGTEHKNPKTTQEALSQLGAKNLPGGLAAPAKAADNSPASASGRSLPAHVVRQVAFNLNQMAARQLSSLRMELKPPAMGEITMELAVKDGAVKASLVAETVAAKKALEAGIEQLKQELVNQGLKVEQISISVQPDAQRRHEAAGNSGRRRHNQRRWQPPAAEENPAAAEDLAGNGGRFSVMA